ncbi:MULTISPECIES: class I SAM-dependent methyltransferase [Streptomyces]|uniref:Methyltransferase domain-containing protein n=1 Tax=Streptomyces koelreuteriae TaxID=2838015 RepID=A0ABX8FMU7_9ACTN|nr:MULTISPECIES: class I SAM-dependent methyltransferase [Streptomyces]QWB22480.1 methyltransferase domain-containing protein [Streptomyces koelreuteriae]UUA05426.1 class I SAM-dependent methyltransferase [Streptomyces koelreuteriae]UUA13052.1 class I SAM-dependent methyltransferase [Streptomyces sp. CRCS-T-1]
MTITSQALSFDKAAAEYAANRPSYPPALLDAVEELAGRPLSGSRVADIGAGTGLATALLHARGARVVAVEPGSGMASQFRRGLPDVPVVLGSGNALPLASESVDLLTYAQAWHWTDPRESVPEALRVLRPGGALALWWNDSDGSAPWIADQDARLRRLFGAEEGAPDPLARFRGLPAELDFARRQVSWTRSVPLDTHLANLASYSDFLVLGEDATKTFLAEERDLLTRAFPNGAVEERYVVSLAVAVR